MITEQDVKLMQTAYGLLYELENSMRIYIKEKMEECYGIHWHHYAPRKVLKRPPSKAFESLLFSEYESYFRNYPNAFKNIPSELYTKLYQLYPIRNKVAHNHTLSLSEYEMLEQYAAFLIKCMDNEHHKSLVTS
ncbi:hypothetical protein BN988_02856 [Oceanobacillus picturae]|uniref:Swt1-like HEPN domain-containing protein n=1 Tax=Oceanobacillus picturae TaxID=171693 RepID=W9AN14_9BACI|nr:hypothetical protein [Oceanobacillus picturae]CDO04302.1 hypothetical protein BN988_02856 [Oceanobacillus picturae]